MHKISRNRSIKCTSWIKLKTDNHEMLSVSSIKTDRIRILGENIYVLLSVSSVKTDRIRILGGDSYELISKYQLMQAE